MLNFNFLGKGLGIDSPPHFVYDFSREMLHKLYSSNFFVSSLPGLGHYRIIACLITPRNCQQKCVAIQLNYLFTKIKAEDQELTLFSTSKLTFFKRGSDKIRSFDQLAKDMFINMRQFLAILWTSELLLHFDQLFSSNLQSGD